ncbi:retrovirus-related pol polyprotein from transposon TNT 1-94 [Tanacetum coccineum]
MVKPSLGLSGSSGTRWMKMVWLSETKQGWLLKGIEKKKGFDYDETIAHVARLKSIRIFLAYAAYMSFMVYQIDVKSAFLNGKLSEEVYVQQPPWFESSKFPNYVCKLDKALYGLNKLDEHASIPDTQFSTFVYARYQANPKKSHLVDVKRIFRYIKETPNLDRKSTLGGCQILREKLVCWSAKKQNSVAMSSVEDMLLLLGVVLKSSGSKVSWLIMISCMKRDHILKGDIELHFVLIDLQLTDIFTKPLAEPSFTRLVTELGILNIDK